MLVKIKIGEREKYPTPKRIEFSLAYNHWPYLKQPLESLEHIFGRKRRVPLIFIKRPTFSYMWKAFDIDY